MSRSDSAAARGLTPPHTAVYGPGTGPVTTPRAANPERPGGDLWRTLADALAPRPCLACERLVAATSRARLGLCRPCVGRLRRQPDASCRRCGRLFADGGSRRCGLCRAATTQPPWRSLQTAWIYAPPLDAVLTGLKFRRLDYLGPRLGAEAVDVLGPRAVLDHAGALDLVTWVPLHWRRRLARGFDQAEGVARGVAAALHLPCRRLLRRRRATPPQSLSPRGDRLDNLIRAFVPTRSARRTGRGLRVLLVDDVVTTGATLRSAARSLRRTGVREIHCLTAARALSPNDAAPALP
ncbi:MAG: phosphoribosyltransferase family protein [Acidobacteriota bacterium]